MSDDLFAVDAEIARLNAFYWRYGYVLVRRRKEVGVHYCNQDGQPTGEPLERFDASPVPGLEDAEEWVHNRVMAAQEGDDR